MLSIVLGLLELCKCKRGYVVRKGKRHYCLQRNVDGKPQD